MKKTNPSINEKIAKEVMKKLLKNNLYYDVNLYYNNHRMYADYDGNVHIVDWDGNCPCEYAPKENHILSLTFEGPLYSKINYDDCFYLDDIFKKYGMYMEQGHAWSGHVYFI